MSDSNEDCPYLTAIQEAWQTHIWPSDELIDHVATCPICQEGLTAMALEANIRPEEILALRLHGDSTATPDRVPDLERLAAYAGVIVEEGAGAAQQQWPMTAAHLNDCPLCAADLQEEVTALSEMAGVPVPAIFPIEQLTLPADPPPPPQTPPAPQLSAIPRSRVVRLAEHPMMRRGSNLITPNARMGTTGGQSYASMRDNELDASATPVITRVEELGHDVGALQWVRLELTYTPRYTGGLRCAMQAAYVTATDGTEKPAVGLRWHVDAISAKPDATPLVEGAFGDNGRDAWHVTADGTYVLTVEYDEREWKVVMTMQEDPLVAMRASRADAPGTYTQMTVWVHGLKRDEQEYSFIIPMQHGVQAPIFVQKRRRIRDRNTLFQRLFEAVTTQVHLAQHPEERHKLGEFGLSTLGDDAKAYIPEDVLKFLFDDTTPLVIATNDPVFPWELVYHNGTFLGMVRPISRMSCNVPLSTSAPWPSDRRMLMVVDPTCNLPCTLEEAAAICQQMDAYHRYEIEQVVQKDATLPRLQQELDGNYEIWHVAGHVDFELRLRDATALPCADGAQLTFIDIREAKGHLGLVFINGCQGARVVNVPTNSISTTAPRLEGLAQAFLARGAVAFISSLWPISDSSAARFAIAFYEAITKGRLSFGEALRRVRKTWYEDYRADPTWAGYVLYGRPDMTLEMLHADDGGAAEQPAPIPFVVKIAPPAASPNHRDVRDGAGDATADDGDSIEMLRPAMSASDQAFHWFCTFANDSDHTLDEAAQAALHETFAWLASRSRSGMYQGDLLLGLARVPDGKMARALAAQGIQPGYLAEINALVLHRDERQRKQILPSEGVKLALQASVARAGAEGRTVVTDRDLADALLHEPLSGTVRKMLDVARVDVPTLRAALHGVTMPTMPNDMPPTPPFIPGADLIHAPDQDAEQELPDLLKDAERNGKSFAPFVAREDELRSVVQSLANATAPHTLLRGPLGVGKTALIREIAKRLAQRGGEAGIAEFAGWRIFQVYHAPGAAPMGSYLTRRLKGLYTKGQPAIIVLDDLAQLAEDPTLVATLVQFSGDPRLRYLATATEAEALALRRQHPELMSLFTPVEMAPPGAAPMRRILRDYADYLGRLEHVIIEQQAQQAAIFKPLADAALPGAAIARLTEAFAMVVVNRPAIQQGTDASVAPNTGGRVVTPEDVQAVIARAGGRS